MNKLYPIIRGWINTAFVILLPAAGQSYAGGLNVEMSANILNGTCLTQISNGGSVDLGTVGKDYFRDETTPDTYQGGGKTFTVTLHDCGAGADSSAIRLNMTFTPRSGQFASGTTQVFPNEIAAMDDGAQNVGIVIDKVDAGGSTLNVWSARGQTQATYTLTSAELEDSIYTFYTRYQKVGLDAVTPGRVTSNIIVDVYYE